MGRTRTGGLDPALRRVGADRHVLLPGGVGIDLWSGELRSVHTKAVLSSRQRMLLGVLAEAHEPLSRAELRRRVGLAPSPLGRKVLDTALERLGALLEAACPSGPPLLSLSGKLVVLRGATLLYGRSKELIRLRSLVDEHLVVAVAGATGVGRSALIRHLLGREVEHLELEEGAELRDLLRLVHRAPWPWVLRTRELGPELIEALTVFEQPLLVECVSWPLGLPVLGLGPLRPEPATELVRQCAPSLSPEVVADLVDKAAGHPGSLLVAASQFGLGGPSSPVLPSLRRAVSASLAGLAPRPRASAAALSSLCRPLAYADAAAICDGDDVLIELARSGLAHLDGGRVRLALGVREEARRGAPSRQLHRVSRLVIERAMLALEGPGPDSELLRCALHQACLGGDALEVLPLAMELALGAGLSTALRAQVEQVLGQEEGDYAAWGAALFDAVVALRAGEPERGRARLGELQVSCPAELVDLREAVRIELDLGKPTEARPGQGLSRVALRARVRRDLAWGRLAEVESAVKQSPRALELEGMVLATLRGDWEGLLRVQDVVGGEGPLDRWPGRAKALRARLCLAAGWHEEACRLAEGSAAAHRRLGEHHQAGLVELIAVESWRRRGYLDAARRALLRARREVRSDSDRCRKELRAVELMLQAEAEPRRAILGLRELHLELRGPESWGWPSWFAAWVPLALSQLVEHPVEAEDLLDRARALAITRPEADRSAATFALLARSHGDQGYGQTARVASEALLHRLQAGPEALARVLLSGGRLFGAGR